PAPRLVDPFGGGHPRLQGRSYTSWDSPEPDPDLVFELAVGRQDVIPLEQRPFRVHIRDEKIIQVEVIHGDLLVVQGIAVGSSRLHLWFGDKDNEKNQTIVSYLIKIQPDSDKKERMERTCKALAEEINRVFSGCNVFLRIDGDKIVADGEVQDETLAEKMLEIVQANAPVNQVVCVPSEQEREFRRTFLGTLFLGDPYPNVVNRLRITEKPQTKQRVLPDQGRPSSPYPNCFWRRTCSSMTR